MRLIGKSVGSDERAGSDAGPDWIDLDLAEAGAESWLVSQIEVGEDTLRLLLTEENRNRRIVVPEGLFLSLCYPSGARDEDAEDAVVCVVVLVTRERIVTLRRGRIPSLEGLWHSLRDSSEGLDSAWHVLAQLIIRLAFRVEVVLDQTAREIDQLEDRVFEDDSQPPIDELGQLRRQLILDRRHITSMARLVEETVDDRVMGPDASSADELRGAVQAMTRLERTVEFFLERANLVQDQIQSLLSERMNTATLRLGVVATVFLPLSFLTGLLGINVAGMPGSHNPLAFWVVCALLTILALGAWIVVARFHAQNVGRMRASRRRHTKSR